MESSCGSVTSYFRGKWSNYSPGLFQVITFEFRERDRNLFYPLNLQLKLLFLTYGKKRLLFLTWIVLINRGVFQKFILAGGSFHNLSIIFVQFLSNIRMLGSKQHIWVWCLTFPIYFSPILLDFSIIEENFYGVFCTKNVLSNLLLTFWQT